MSLVIKIDKVSKKYAKNYKSALKLLKRDLLNSIFCSKENFSFKCEKNEFLVINNISFEIYKNERVAILGSNGAGKSTLLKMIFGIILPDDGIITVNGVVGGILELGGGLKNTLSGRENIYYIGSFYGKSKKEIDNMIDEIVEFTDLGEFIDSPVSFYSSGMKSKLSFALYLYMKPDILVLDEIFATGDKKFRLKAKEKLLKIVYSSTTILVSHNIGIVREIATRVIVLNKGKIIFDGNVDDGIKVYENL
jgi:lipopolysaccharide transport system ATP-binding protein